LLQNGFAIAANGFATISSNLRGRVALLLPGGRNADGVSDRDLRQVRHETRKRPIQADCAQPVSGRAGRVRPGRFWLNSLGLANIQSREQLAVSFPCRQSQHVSGLQRNNWK
jgi:hypothetical protein